MHPAQTSSTASSNAGIALSRAASMAERAAFHSRVEKDSLPGDIWFLIAQDHLVDSPATIAALSSTNRQFHALLRSLKFRTVSIRLHTSSVGIINTSPALRFAQVVRREPEIADQVHILWIGHEEDFGLRAIDDEFADDEERRSLCYILSLQYPNLKHLALSFRYATVNPYTLGNFPKLPYAVLHSVLSALSLSSLSEVSLFMGSVPWEVHSRLQEIQIDTLNLSARMIDREEQPPQERTDWRSQTDKLRTLRIDDSEGNTMGVFFPKPLHVVITSARLTTLVLKSTIHSAVRQLPKASCPTLITLKLYFFRWHDDVPGPNIVDLRAFSALRTLTIGFNFTVKRPTSATAGQRQLEWIIDVLRSIQPDQPLECVNLFIDDLDHSHGWVDRINHLPWSNLQNLFSLGSPYLHWPTLQQLNIGFAARDDKAFESSDWALLEHTLRARLSLLLHGGTLRLFVPSSSKTVLFDDFRTIRT